MKFRCGDYKLSRKLIKAFFRFNPGGQSYILCYWDVVLWICAAGRSSRQQQVTQGQELYTTTLILGKLNLNSRQQVQRLPRQGWMAILYFIIWRNGYADRDKAMTEAATASFLLYLQRPSAANQSKSKYPTKIKGYVLSINIKTPAYKLKSSYVWTGVSWYAYAATTWLDKMSWLKTGHTTGMQAAHVFLTVNATSLL